MNLEARLRGIEARLVRLELLAYLGYEEVRRVAEYAYQNDLQVAEYAADLDATAVEPLRRLRETRSQMNVLSDQEALVSGLSLEQLTALKRMSRDLLAVCRKEALVLGKTIADLMVAVRESESQAEEEHAA